MAQCVAHRKSNGQRCKSQAIAGATVCRMHGGGAPQVREAARLRLLALVDPALAALDKAMRSQGKSPAHNSVAVQAARDVLDRNGLKVADEHVITGADGGPVQIVVAPVSVRSDADDQG